MPEEDEVTDGKAEERTEEEEQAVVEAVEDDNNSRAQTSTQAVSMAKALST